MNTEYNYSLDRYDKIGSENMELINRLESAYKTYKLSEVFLKDVYDDYGKQKIARLRFEFARHELLTLIKEAREKGVNWENSDMIRKYFHPGS